MKDQEPTAAADPASIRTALDQAWRDHHHVRDQTWKAIQIEAILAAGLLTVDLQYKALVPTLFAAVLVAWASLFGMLISLRHRRVEVKKFKHITNFERALHLLDKDLIPPDSIKPPNPLKWWHTFDPREGSTASFILRMHAAIFLFAMVVVVARLLQGV